MRKGIIYLEPLTCPSCLVKIEAAVKGVEGVDKNSINVLFNSSKVNLEFNDNKTSIKEIANAIIKVGYEVKRTRIS